ncbi:Retrovirus-related Pol polyprotein from type-1 retrotransposable element [Trichinella britovi]|uniref:Retrovirus-related Pol polyprotein from type-1 retrotransposable element n=1 Tax=Trichinella britovi TaxID=45882 RepID=A0A0V1C5N5_TRIBR|nr:Retrovirus-related Pol polyprotein from type-1 retrotransposable element [Trichinella britovi]
MGKQSRPAQEKSSTAAGSDGQARSDRGRRNHAEVLYPGPFKCTICTFTECVYSRFSNHCMKHGLHLELHCSICTKVFPSIYSVACHYSRCAKTQRNPENPEIPSGFNLNVVHSNESGVGNSGMKTRSSIKRATVVDSCLMDPLFNVSTVERTDARLVCAMKDDRRVKLTAVSAPLKTGVTCQSSFEALMDSAPVVFNSCKVSEIKEVPPARINMRLRSKMACKNIPESPRPSGTPRTAPHSPEGSQSIQGSSAPSTSSTRVTNNRPANNNAQGTHVCSVCSRAFNSFPGLRLHEKRTHPATFAASSQKSVKHQWTIDHLREVKEVEEMLAANNSRSVQALAEALSRKWSEAISMDMAKYLRKKLRAVDLNSAQSTNTALTDGVSSPREGPENTTEEGESLINGSQVVGTEIMGPERFPECDSLQTHSANADLSNPCPQHPEGLLSEQGLDRDQGGVLRKHLEDGSASCNSELEGLLNFIVNKILNSGNEDRNKHVDAAISVLIEFLREPKSHQPPPPRKKRTREEPKNRRQKIRSNVTPRVPAYLFKNQPLCNVSCPIDAAESALRQRLSQRPGVDAAPFTSKCPQNSKNILDPIFPEEVTLHVQKMKIHTSAGPDGIKVSHLRSCDPVCLAKAFNIFLLARHIPQQLKDCRTTLIPKSDDPRPDAEDYRPITVASCLYRLFSKIVTRRLEDPLSLHPRQKAFRSFTDGAFDNTSILMTVIREAHNCGKELIIVSIDLAKAFDTVNHTSITRALCMHRLDDESRTLITQMVTGSSTIIKGDKGALSNKIEINQGVRQGDPISPLLFNAVMDEMVERLEQTGEGFKLKGVEVTTLAFADDRPANSENSQMPCHLISDATCGFSFATFSGLHLHRKRAHPDVFAAACGKKTKVRWSNDEISLLATLEAGLDPACKNINQVLAERLMEYDITRGVEMIKGQRRKEQYKALVRQLRSKSVTQQCVGFAGSMDSNVPVNDTTSSVASEVTITYPEYGAVMSCDLIKEATGMAIVDINELQNNIRKVFSSGRNPPTKFRGARESVPKKMANPRVAKFKRFQRLFRSNRRKLASHIFDKASLEQFGGSIDEASDHLEKFLSRPRLESDSYSAISGDKSIGVAHPILAEEVELEFMNHENSP